MAFESVTLTPLNIRAGDTPIRAKEIVIPANQATVPALTPMKRDANYKAVPATALDDEIIGILVPGIGSAAGALVGSAVSASDRKAYVYTQIDVWADQINWPAAADNDLKKDALFDQSGITVKFAAAGLD